MWSLLGALGGCKSESPAGTVVADWTYESTATDSHVAPTSKRPPQTIASMAEWPVTGGPAVKLRFETEIGDLADGPVHWNWPRHVVIKLAEPTKAKLPTVFCMVEPPGNKSVGGKLVRPVGRDGVTPTGLVGCFFNGPGSASYVFDINGDGEVTRSVPEH